jgi:type VI protein secretion system component VasF
MNDSNSEDRKYLSASSGNVFRKIPLWARALLFTAVMAMVAFTIISMVFTQEVV